MAVLACARLLSCGLVLSMACNHECEPGVSRCVDDGFEVCVGVGGGEAGYDHYEWQRIACPDSYQCVIASDEDLDPPQFALCAYGGIEDPRCQDVEFCDGDAISECRGGYVWRREPCPAEQPWCIDAATVDAVTGPPFCAVSDAPDPACPDTPDGLSDWPGVGYCDGTAYVQCYEAGYVVGTIECRECSTDPEQPYRVICSG